MVNVRFPDTKYVRAIFSCRQNNPQVVVSKFNDGDFVRAEQRRELKEYTYELLPHLVGKVEVGDMCLCHCATGYQIVEIVEVNALPPANVVAFSPIISKVDFTPYFEYMEQQRVLTAMREQIEAKKKSLESMITYELIAEKNPEFKEMLEAYRNAGGTF